MPEIVKLGRDTNEKSKRMDRTQHWISGNNETVFEVTGSRKLPKGSWVYNIRIVNGSVIIQNGHNSRVWSKGDVATMPVKWFDEGTHGVHPLEHAYETV